MRPGAVSICRPGNLRLTPGLNKSHECYHVATLPHDVSRLLYRNRKFAAKIKGRFSQTLIIIIIIIFFVVAFEVSLARELRRYFTLLY